MMLPKQMVLRKCDLSEYECCVLNHCFRFLTAIVSVTIASVKSEENRSRQL